MGRSATAGHHRARAALCFTGNEIRIDSGEAAGSIEPGTHFRGRRRIIRKGLPVAFSNLRSELRAAKRFADAQTRPQVERIARIADRGMRRIQRHPDLLVRGGVHAFERADELARRAHLRGC